MSLQALTVSGALKRVDVAVSISRLIVIGSGVEDASSLVVAVSSNRFGISGVVLAILGVLVAARDVVVAGSVVGGVINGIESVVVAVATTGVDVASETESSASARIV